MKVNPEEDTEEAEVASEEKEENTIKRDQLINADISKVDTTLKEVEIDAEEPPTVAPESLPEVAKPPSELCISD